MVSMWTAGDDRFGPGVLLDRNVASTHVHRELFHVGTPITRRRVVAHAGTPLTGSAVTVILDGRSLTFTSPRDGIRSSTRP